MTDLHPDIQAYLDEHGLVAKHVHDAARCAGRPCVMHNPSDHHMRSWPLHWRDDRVFFERICPHGVGHPDPDCVSYDPNVSLHGCDGCCYEGGDLCPT